MSFTARHSHSTSLTETRTSIPLRLAVVALATALGAIGCGPDIATYCQELEDCRGGNDKDVEACVAELEGDAEKMDVLGCTEEFETYFECVQGELECREQSLGVSCSTNADCDQFDSSAVCSGGECKRKSYSLPDDSEACKAESRAFSRCN